MRHRRVGYPCDGVVQPSAAADIRTGRASRLLRDGSARPRVVFRPASGSLRWRPKEGWQRSWRRNRSTSTVAGCRSPSSRRAGTEAPAARRSRAVRSVASRGRRLKKDKVAMAGGVFVVLLILMAAFADRWRSSSSSATRRTTTTPTRSTRTSAASRRSARSAASAGTSCSASQPRHRPRRASARSSTAPGSRCWSRSSRPSSSVVIGVAARHHRRLLRRLDRLADQPHDGPLPRVPAAAVRDRLDLASFRPRPRPSGIMVAGRSSSVGFFSWPYIGRIVRGQTLSLREREFVEAARSIGAGSLRILFRELLPNLVAPILVYSTLIIPTNILFEAALSFLGVGVPPPQPVVGRAAVGRVQLLPVRPDVHDHPGFGDLPHRARLQPVR